MEMVDKRVDLKILSASAGSGKTFSLVQEFLKLTLTNGEKGSFSKIIAMTFTNKASLEMKERIIEALDLLSHQHLSSQKAISKRDALLSITAENTQLEKGLLQHRAQKVLKEILHHYEDFNVLTIDKFSLRLIRTFARDLDIQQDFKVVLEEKQLLEQVVDDLLSNIGRDEHKRLTKLALRYAKSNLEEGEKWNFRKNLIDFSSVLIKESNQEFVAKVLEKEYSSEEYDTINAKLKTIKSQYEVVIKNWVEHFQSFNLSKGDLPGGMHGVLGLADKLEKQLEENPIRLRKYKAVEASIEGSNLKEGHSFPDELRKSIIRLYEETDTIADEFYCYNLLRKNFYNLALLKYVGEQLQNIRKEESIIRISEFNAMISKLISEENAPYIYERLGTKFSHYLLDEFQDTSRLQWLNLIPLLHDAVGQGNFNLIVGDPKQAIYRFRNGLVEQFIELPEIYNPEGDPELSAISHQFNAQGSKEPLEANWRSDKNIVEFNNLFFPDFVDPLHPDIKKAYEDVEQIPMGKDGGYVEFKHYPDKMTNAEYADYELENIHNWIRECEADGFKRGDICLLARNAKDGRRWAQYLTKQKEAYKVVSSDSLAIGADKTIQLFVDYLNLRRNYNNHTKQTQFAVSYFVQQSKDPLEELKELWDGRVGKLKMNEFIERFFESRKNLIYNYDNLYDLGQQFARLFNVDELNNPYLHHLMEMLQEYDLNEGPDIKGFLEFWTQKGSTETVQIPENDEAIKIMTVHKSKGLEFPIVMLPKLGWEIKMREENFLSNDGTIYYTSLKKDNAPEFITQEYESEHYKKLMDEFNLLYVAMTRPVNRLYASVKKNGANTVESEIIKQLTNINDTRLITEEKDDFELYSFGEKSRNESTHEDESKAFRPEKMNDYLWFPEISLQDKDALEEEDLSQERRFGNQLHLILSKVNTPNDLTKQMKALLLQGKLENEMLKDLDELAKKALSNEEYLSLINRGVKILNEQDILLDVNDIKRPDKLILTKDGVIIIDFKTGKQGIKDEQQVNNYAFALRELGYLTVEGYLFYLRDNEVKKVC